MVNCVVCNNSVAQGILSWHAQCKQCGYESAAFLVSINEANAHAGIDEEAREASLKQLRQENFRTIVDHARHYAAPGARSLLDVGSAHGWFLEVAAREFDVLGIEPDAQVGGKAAARGLPVRPGYFPDVLKQDERFDIIVFNDVIEHIPDIRAALAACRERLNPGGILILNLPNSQGFFYRLSKLLARFGLRGPFERMWQKDMPSPHLHYFDTDNLSTLLADQAFDRVFSTELVALQPAGLKERLSYVGKSSALKVNVQYLAIRCLLPFLRLFPSDIIVGIYRRGG